MNLIEVFAVLAPPALVLLDEPGVGTDPDEGAALAVALVDHAMGRGALVAAATHYAAVKLYALNEPRIELAAVDIDPVRFAPRFRLVYGSLGESLGLAMARQLGLPAPVLAAAEARRTMSARELADAIARLETSRRRHDEEHQAVVDERRALAELEREHSRLVAELRERRRARWDTELAEARDFVRALKAEGREILDLLRRRPPDAARTFSEFVRGRDEEIAARAAATAEPAAAPESPPALGAHVEVRGSTIRGEVAEINGDVARVQRGSVSFRVPLAQLRVVPAPTPSPGPPFVSRGTGPRSARVVAADDAPPTELHLVGLRTAEALDRLERFLDHAQTAGVASVRIVHGIGSGALKRAVTEYLARSSYCTRFTEAEPNRGGAGVTVAELL